MQEKNKANEIKNENTHGEGGRGADSDNINSFPKAAGVDSLLLYVGSFYVG